MLTPAPLPLAAIAEPRPVGARRRPSGRPGREPTCQAGEGAPVLHPSKPAVRRTAAAARRRQGPTRRDPLRAAPRRFVRATSPGSRQALRRNRRAGPRHLAARDIARHSRPARRRAVVPGEDASSIPLWFAPVDWSSSPTLIHVHVNISRSCVQKTCNDCEVDYISLCPKWRRKPFSLCLHGWIVAGGAGSVTPCHQREQH